MTDPKPERKRAPGPDICIILNPGSGKSKRESRRQIEAAVARHPGRFEMRVLRKGQDIADVARGAVSDGFAVLVAAGGDGTIGAVAEVVQEAGLTLGLLSMGTFNFFARGLDLPEDIEAATDLIVRGSTRKIFVGEVNGRMFLNNASIGLYPAILAQREGIYKRWGRSRMAAHWSVLRTFMRFHRPLSLTVVVDGRPIRRQTPIVFVARSAFQLEFFDVDGVADVEAGKFGLFIAPDKGRLSLILFALRLAWKSTSSGRDFDYMAGSSIDIETRSKRRLIARDGEREKMRSPFVFRMRPDPLIVIAPEAN
ncbi:MAG: diacylglycerol kinase family protein [Jannaschia sp.]